MTVSNPWIPLIGRILLGAIFLMSGLMKIGNFGGTAEDMVAHGVPMASIALVIAIILEAGGAALIILGWKTALGALALVVFTVVVTPVYHAFWAVPDEMVQFQMAMFLKNLSMIGGLLILMFSGPGALSLDGRSRQAAAQPA